jgi:hypothetical protein
MIFNRVAIIAVCVIAFAGRFLSAQTPDASSTTAGVPSLSASGAPDNYIVTQHYQLFSTKDGGGGSKNLTQTLYVSPTRFKIEDKKDTFIIDFGAETLTHLKHVSDDGGTWFKESFRQIEERVQTRKTSTIEKIKTYVGQQRSEYASLWSGLIEIDRKYKIELKPEKTMVGALQSTHRLIVRATDEWNKDKVVLDALLTKKYKIPAENARVLFLLELAGEQLAAELKGINALPLKLKITLPDGGEATSELNHLTPVGSHPMDTWSIPRKYIERSELQKDPTTETGPGEGRFKVPTPMTRDDDE